MFELCMLFLEQVLDTKVVKHQPQSANLGGSEQESLMKHPPVQ